MNIQYRVYYASELSKHLYRTMLYRNYGEARDMFDQLRMANGGTEGLWLVESNSTIERKLYQDHKDYKLITL